MKKRTFFQSFLIAVFVCLVPQKALSLDYSKMNLYVVYIDHETSTPVTRLIDKLKKRRNDIIEMEEDPDALIVYLADGSTPLVSLTNLPDTTGRDRNKEETFYAIFDALQNVNSHNIIEREDRSHLLQLFDEFNFVDDNENLRFKSVTIDFYIGPSFWALGNEKLISHLYVALGVAKFPKVRFSYNIYKPKDIELGYSDEEPFGVGNLDGINQELHVLEY